MFKLHKECAKPVCRMFVVPTTRRCRNESHSERFNCIRGERVWNQNICSVWLGDLLLFSWLRTGDELQFLSCILYYKIKLKAMPREFIKYQLLDVGMRFRKRTVNIFTWWKFGMILVRMIESNWNNQIESVFVWYTHHFISLSISYIFICTSFMIRIGIKPTYTLST